MYISIFYMNYFYYFFYIIRNVTRVSALCIIAAAWPYTASGVASHVAHSLLYSDTSIFLQTKAQVRRMLFHISDSFFYKESSPFGLSHK